MKHRRILALILVLCLAVTTCVIPAAAEESVLPVNMANVQGTLLPAATEDTVIAVGTVIVQDTLNVRSGPGTSYSKVGTLIGGQRVAIYETKTVSSTTWGRMDLGWISLDYVILDEDLEFTDAGYCGTGEDLLWGYAEDAQLLVIVGEGPMLDYPASASAEYMVPWLGYRSEIRTLVVDYGVTYVGDYTFNDCTALRFAYVSDTVTAMGDGTFTDCISLLDFYLPDTVTTVGGSTFRGCYNLLYAWLPAGLTALSSRMFEGCTALQEVVMPTDVTEIASSAFDNCTGITEISLPEGLTTIGEFAFSNCTGLTHIDFPKSLTSLDRGAFYNCYGLESMQFNGNAPVFGSELFADVVADVYYPANNFTWSEEVRQDYGGTLTWHAIDIPGSANPVITGICGDNLTWTLAEGVLTISGTGDMYDYYDSTDYGVAPWYSYKDAITQVILPDGITSIGEYAFYEASSLTAVTIPDSVTKIGRQAFYSCDALATITLPAGLTEITDRSFAYCTSLKEIAIPAQVEEIEVCAFDGSGLEKITFLGDAPSIGSDAFVGVVATAYYPAGNDTWTEDVMENYCGTITWEPWGEVEVPDVTYTNVSLSMAGDIGLNYYVQLSDQIVSDSGAYMEFTYADQVQTVPLSQALLGDDGTYRFSCAIPAKRMTDVVTGQMYTSEGPVGEAKQYSVKQYCTAMKAYVETNGLTGYDSLLNLLDAMLNYGAYSQLSFGYNTGDLANADLAEADKALPETLDASAYAHSVSGSEEGIAVYSASLLLESRTTIRFYFTLTGDRGADDYTFTVDGEPASLSQTGSLYYIDVPNIAAKDLDTMHTVETGGLSVSYCGLSYVNQMLTWSGAAEANVNTAKALYLYNQAANEYFGA